MKRALGLVVVTLAMLALPAGAQTFQAVAFGDSITDAQAFDVGGGSNCVPGQPDTCGYAARLSKPKFYDCANAKCQFSSRGLPGETTAQGITRFNQVLNQKPWDLVMLMEGSNDINQGISAQTASFNLEQMAVRANSMGIGVAQASIPWLNPTFSKPNTVGLNQNAQSLRSLIQTQAGSSGRCFVDINSRLCPAGSSQQSCFNNNYWNLGRDGVGHPNGNGYNMMADEFYKVLGGKGAPGAVDIVAPIGEACGKAANLSWTKGVNPKNCGNWFRVEITSGNGTLLDNWYQERDLCSGNDCTLISPVKLTNGTFSLRIRNRNTAGYGPWSASESFTVVPSAPRKVGKVFGPKAGTFYIDGGLETEFEWKAVGDARSYQLEILSTTGFEIDEILPPGAETCDGKKCRYAPAEPLPTGSYTWRVRALNVCGGAWTDPITLDVFDGPPSVAPQTLGPTARIFEDAPTFTWETVPGATEFEVEDAFGATARLTVEDACEDGICRLDSAALAQGSHTWRVRAINPLGEGVWSDSVAFEVADCDCFRGKAAGGSSFLLAKPTTWNGDLVIWAPRSNRLGIREIEDFGPLAQRQFDEGYALGTTSYTVSGWPLFKSRRDLEKVYKTFVLRHGEPNNVYLVGESVGALAALEAVETADLGNLTGALATCGPLAGARNWEGALDIRLAYDALCGSVIGAAIPGGPKGLPKPHDFEPADIREAVNFCTGADLKPAQRSDEQRVRLNQLISVTQIPAGGLQDAMQLATFGLFDLVRDRKKLKGSLPVGNDTVDYQNPVLNTTIQRASAEIKGQKQLAKFELTGDVGETKVISLHTNRDSFFYAENQTEYTAIVPATNLATGIISEKKPSHCGFNEVELVASWRALELWSKGGKKPKAKNLQNRCNGLKKSVGGSCRFLKKPRLDSLDTRIRPRP